MMPLYPPADDRGSIVVLQCRSCDARWITPSLGACPACESEDVEVVDPDDLDDWDDRDE